MTNFKMKEKIVIKDSSSTVSANEPIVHYISIWNIIVSAVAELYAIFNGTSQLCTAVAIVALVRKSVVGISYWPLKITLAIKGCAVPCQTRFDAIVGVPTDCLGYFILDYLSSRLHRDFLSLKGPQQTEYEVVYKFILNFIWAMQTNFVIRAMCLTLTAILWYF